MNDNDKLRRHALGIKGPYSRNRRRREFEIEPEIFTWIGIASLGAALAWIIFF